MPSNKHYNDVCFKITRFAAIVTKTDAQIIGHIDDNDSKNNHTLALAIIYSTCLEVSVVFVFCPSNGEYLISGDDVDCVVISQDDDMEHPSTGEPI